MSDRLNRLRVRNADQKGGVGKTTVSLGMGEAYAEDPEVGREALSRFIDSLSYGDLKRIGKTKTDVQDRLARVAIGGRRVLVVDYDPLSHLSDQLGIPQSNPAGKALSPT
ncbi:ParA family protein [Streptomyces sp. NPDC054804]